MVPERTKPTAYTQFGVLVTVNAVKNGCVSIPTLVTMRLGKPVKVKLVTWQTTVILNTTCILGIAVKLTKPTVRVTI